MRLKSLTLSRQARRGTDDDDGLLMTKSRASIGVILSWTLLGLVFFTGIFGPILRPQPIGAVDIYNTFAPPVWSGGTWSMPLGTDALGRDLATQIIHGATNSIMVAGIVTIGACIIGTFLGLAAGFYGGWLDRIIGRLVEAQLSLPLILVALALIISFGTSMTTLIGAMISATWVPFARIIRGEARTLRNGDMVRAARVTGLTSWRIVTRHVLRNVMASVIVLISMTFGEAIILEASLSFLSLGVQPPDVSWGLMISEARQHIGSNPWIVIAPSVALGVTALSSNVLGDYLRDRLDPRLRRLG